MATYMTKQAAAILGMAERTVQKYCKDLGIQQMGGKYYLIDDDALEKIRELKANTKKGPPLGSKNKKKTVRKRRKKATERSSPHNAMGSSGKSRVQPR